MSKVHPVVDNLMFYKMVELIFLLFFCRDTFRILFCARFIGGFGSGVIFILVPIYMKELVGAKYNGNIVDLLITQFGLGIFTQYFIGE